MQIPNRNKKIAIIGAGNAGCMTAISAYLKYKNCIDEISIYYDPETPIERVGQGSTYSVAQLLNAFFNLDFFEYNSIKSTRKEGILYENWGKKNEKIFHSFPQSFTALHYVPSFLSQKVLKSGVFNIVEKNIKDPEQEIDADFIIDCRGRHNRSQELYDQLINPLNSVLISQKEVQKDLFYTRTVTTPDGWTFVIPNVDNTSYGYLYNNSVTSTTDAKNNFIELFDIENPIDGFSFENYIAKNCFQSDRLAFNGNRLCFLEPLEATSTAFHLNVADAIFDHVFWGIDKQVSNQNVRNQIKRLQDFILWHYQFGSKYDTPFWDYAKSLPFNPEPEFYEMLDYINQGNSYDELVRISSTEEFSRFYGHWSSVSFKVWADGMGT